MLALKIVEFHFWRPAWLAAHVRHGLEMSKNVLFFWNHNEILIENCFRFGHLQSGWHCGKMFERYGLIVFSVFPRLWLFFFQICPKFCLLFFQLLKSRSIFFQKWIIIFQKELNLFSFGSLVLILAFGGFLILLALSWI